MPDRRVKRWLQRKAFLELLEMRALFASDLWQSVENLPPPSADQVSFIRSLSYRNYRLDGSLLADRLAQAPMEQVGIASDVVLELPKPNGEWEHFRIMVSPIMEPDLAAKFPRIQTYAGQGIENPASKLRFDVTPAGFHAQVLTPDGAYYIDPYYHLDTSFYSVYYASGEFRAPVMNELPMQELPPTNGSGGNGGVGMTRPPEITSGTELRTYRAVVAATGEYTRFHGGTVELGQAAVVTAMNRVSGIYESELSIRMVLIENNDRVIYTDAQSDPYTNNNGFAMLGENQANLDAVIGNGNYDIGHVFSTGGGGVAALASVGISTIKGQGVTGSPEPVGDAFWVDYVAHEIGHQFGGNHTMNGIAGACGARNGSTAYEPGSGVTIQAYAGICGADDLAMHSDPYFHSVSFEEMIEHVDTTIPNVGTRSATNNAIPTVDAGRNFTIPTQTPFVLTATGQDANTDQVLTYDWQQRDLGPAQGIDEADNGRSPLFRTWPPTESGSRTFPRLQDLAAGQLAKGEKLPTLPRTMNFRVIVRDNRLNGGASNTDDMQVTVVDTGAPFRVTSPNTNVSWEGFSTQTITWDVAGTTANGIDTPNVDILFSFDGGLTFPRVLASGVPNDGSHDVRMPGVATDKARIRVQGSGHIFFDISDVDFVVTQSPLSSDFGDAPDSYGTTVAANGPQHIASTLLLGTDVDSEEDGQPSADASGDGADDDGVVFDQPLVRGQTSSVQITASESGVLNYYFDFDRSGTFGNQPNEIFSENVVAGTQRVSVTVPDGLGVTTFARFRLSKLGVSGPLGNAPDGEVEDYQVEIAAPPPVLSAPDASVAYMENDPLRSVASTLTVQDPYRASYPGAVVRARFQFGIASQDVLGVISEAAGPGRITVIGTNVQFGSDVIGTLTSLANGLEVSLTAACTPLALQALLRSIGYSNTSDAPDTRVRLIDLQLSGGFGVITVPRRVEVTPVNDSPVLSVGVVELEEDVANPSGLSLLGMFETGFRDPDLNASLTGVAIVANPKRLDQGEWYYSSNFGGSWSLVGDVNDSDLSLVLQRSDWIGFKPAADFFGEPEPLLVRGLDNTYGGPFSNAVQNRREYLSAGVRGVNGPVSAIPSEIRGLVQGVNDAPRPTQEGVSVTAIEDEMLNIILPAGLFVDVDSPSMTWSIGPEGITPDWLSFHSQTRRLTGTPANEDVGIVQLILSAVDADRAEGSMTLTLTVVNVNDPPTQIQMVQPSVMENVAGGLVGSLRVVDPDANERFTWTVSDPRFRVIDGSLYLAEGVAFDFETTQSIEVGLIARDSGVPSLEVANTFTIAVMDENEAFPELSSQVISIAHGTSGGELLATLLAPDADTFQQVRMTLKSGDIEAFTLDPVTGELRFASGMVADRTVKPEYVVIVEAADNGSPVRRRSAQIKLEVLPFNGSSPVVGANQVLTVNERGALNVAIGQVAVTDADGDSIVGYEIIDPTIANLFFIEPSTGIVRLRRADVLDFETTPSYFLPIRVTDSGTPARIGEGTIQVVVTDGNDPPLSISVGSNRFPTRRAGAELVVPQVTEQDGGGRYVFSTTDERFEFRDGVLSLRPSRFFTAEEAGLTFQISVLVVDMDDPTSRAVLPLTVGVAADGSPWQNELSPLNVNRDGLISPQDALQVLNYLNSGAGRLLPQVRTFAGSSLPDVDVNADGSATPLDALLILNHLNVNGTTEAEGEGGVVVKTVKTVSSEDWMGAFEAWEHEWNERRRWRR